MTINNFHKKLYIVKEVLIASHLANFHIFETRVQTIFVKNTSDIKGRKVVKWENIEFLWRMLEAIKQA